MWIQKLHMVGLIVKSLRINRCLHSVENKITIVEFQQVCLFCRKIADVDLSQRQVSKTVRSSFFILVC